MIARRAVTKVLTALSRQAAVGLLGPRQVGKTTLAHEVAAGRNAAYVDLESKSGRDKLTDPELFIKAHEDDLIILDEIHRAPEIFPTLRGIIDEGRRKGKRTGRFLVLGSASVDMLRQSSESLAGRIEYVEMGPLDILETGSGGDALWLRGGFPDSYLAASEEDSYANRKSFIRTYLERDIPQFGPQIPAETLERLWIMLAHGQGGLLNLSRLASSLAVSSPTVSSYVSLLSDLLLVRKLQPFHANLGKRLVKSPKVYIRDSGIVHALLGIKDMDDLLSHPVCGPSWEGFVIENLISAATSLEKASFYRTAAGAEIDLVLELGAKRGIWAIEIKRSLSPKPERGFYQAIEDLKPAKAFVAYAGSERYPLGPNLEAISVADLAAELASST